jgi:hypothetical protein
MIDLGNEAVLTLSHACQLPELRRNGRSPHVTTLLRWALRGCRGVKLETARSGGRRVTSREAVIRFLIRLNGGAPEPSASASELALAHARAEAALTLAGI